jgi:hypothetical protein
LHLGAFSSLVKCFQKEVQSFGTPWVCPSCPLFLGYQPTLQPTFLEVNQASNTWDSLRAMHPSSYLYFIDVFALMKKEVPVCST